MAASTTPGQPTGSVGGAPAGGGPTGRPDHNGIGATRIEPNRSAMVSAASARRALAEPGEVGRRGSAVWRVVIGCTGARAVAEAAASAPPPAPTSRLIDLIYLKSDKFWASRPRLPPTLRPPR